MYEKYIEIMYRIWKLVFLTFFLLIAVWNIAQALDERKTVIQIELTGTVNRGMEMLISRALSKAQLEKADAIILIIDTYGGFLNSMDNIISMLIDTNITTIAYIYPKGAKAASAGAFIALASDFLIMSEGTTIGSSQPIPPEPKYINYAAARMKMLAQRKYGENDSRVDLAVDMVTKNADYTEVDAYKLGLIDGIANTVNEALRISGFDNVKIIKLDKNIIEELYSLLSEPIIINLLMTLGILMLIAEVSAPGIGIAGFIGATLLVLALLGLSIVKPSFTFIILMILAIGLLILELKKPGIQVFGIAGIALMILAFTLIYREQPYRPFRIPEAVVFIAIGILGSIFVIYLRSISRILKKEPVISLKKLVGMEGIAKSDIKPREPGVVLVASDTWTAYSDEVIKSGDRVIVVKVEGLKVYVKKINEEKK